MEKINYLEFKKVELRVAEILEAEKIEGADKLLKLQVNLGDEKRQLVAGIAQKYTPDQLVGKKLIIVANLEPAKIRGVESNGMILAGVKDGQAVIPFFTEDIDAGAEVR